MIFNAVTDLVIFSAIVFGERLIFSKGFFMAGYTTLETSSRNILMNKLSLKSFEDLTVCSKTIKLSLIFFSLVWPAF